MYPQEIINKKPSAESRINLTLLVMILGFLALLSIGIMAISIFQQLYPSAGAAINKQLNYQGKLQDSGGITVPDGDYDIKFSIYDAASGGNRLWTECGTTGTPTARTVTVTNGIFSVLLGDTASGACPGPAGGNAINLKFDSDSYYLGITIEADLEMTPRKHIGAAGYSFNADLLDALDTSNDGGSACLTPGACAYVPVTDSSGNFMIDLDTLYVDSANARVGIGTTSPLAKLHVYAPGTTTVIYSEDFDSGGTWTNGGTTVPPFDWSARSEVAPDSGTDYWAYNDGVSDGYDTGGAFDYYSYSGSFDLSVTTSPVLRLKYMLDMEEIGSSYDRAFVEIVDAADPTSVYQSWELTENKLSWTTFSQALSPWMGNVRVRVRIYTGDEVGNSGFGFRVDTVRVAEEAEADAAYFQGRVGINTLPSYALDVTSSGDRTVNAVNTATSGYGGYFTAAGDGGSAVYGEATATGGFGPNYGGYFLADGDYGVGVYGQGQTGVSGYSPATGGIGTAVDGYAPGTTGLRVTGGNFISGDIPIGFSMPGNDNVGIFASGSSTTNTGWGGVLLGNDIGVYANQTDASGYAGWFVSSGNGSYGVLAEASGAGSYGVYGRASNSGATANYGGYFLTAGQQGRGVYGEASDGIGVNYGGYFVSAGAGAGASGVFGTTAAKTNGVYGVQGTATGTGAYANVGGHFEAAGEAGMGVQGYSTSSAVAANYGGYFISSGTGTGASGVFGGVLGAANNVYGVGGIADSSGAYTNYGGWFYAKGQTGVGVYGWAGSLTGPNYGGKFLADGAASYGVYGEASSVTGTTYGIYGKAFSGTGWAGYFIGGYGVYTDNDLYVGGTSETLANAGFTMTGAGSGYFADKLGVEGNVYTDGSFITGASTTYADGSITTDGTTDLSINTAGDDIIIDASDQLGIGLTPLYALDILTDGSRAINATTTDVSGLGIYAASPYYAGLFVASGDSGKAVVGDATASTGAANYGGWFQAQGDGGAYGVYGIAGGATGTNYGIYGDVTSTTGWAGYFTGGQGVYVERLCLLGDCRTTWPLGGGGGSPGGVTTNVQYNDTGAFAGENDFTWDDVNNYLYVAARVGIGLSPSSPLDVTTSGDTYGARVVNSTVSGYAVYGAATDPSAGNNYGGYFTAAGSFQAGGVYGGATDTTSQNYGGFFLAKGVNSARGVMGWADNTADDITYGGFFVSAAKQGRGVYGYAYDTAGTNYGGYFTAAGSGAGTSGVYGEATDNAGTVYGGYFKTSSPSGYGVYGQSQATGVGVYGAETNPSGGGIGVQGFVNNPWGWAGYFTGGQGLYASAGVIGAATGGYMGAGTLNAKQLCIEGDCKSSWPTGSGTPGGANTNVQFNDSSAFGGDADFTWDKTNNYLYVASRIGIGTAPSYALDVTTSGARAINATTSAVGGYGVYGTATSAAATANYGGYFSAAGTAAGTSGVRGIANGAAAVYGVYGSTTSTTAASAGVRGENTAASGANYGGYFTTASTGGFGVYSIATATTGASNYGGYFEANGTVGGSTGVYGYASGSGATYGVYGISGGYGTGAAGVYGTVAANIGNQTYGVFGNNTATTGPAYGVYGSTASATGRGVYGNAASTTALTSVNYGGYFTASGVVANTSGVYGATASTAAVANYGGRFISAGTGTGASGVYGSTGSTTGEVYGVYGSTASATGRGVYGNAASTTAGTSVNYGGYFTASGVVANTSGVYGATASTALVANYGGYFTAGGTGAGASGVRGIANGAGQVYGVYGSTSSATAGAAGVYGQATGAAVVYGVYGVGPATGWAGYFSGGEGVYTNEIHINDNTTGITYNRIGTTATSDGLASNNDLMITGQLEVDGLVYVGLSSTSSTTAVCSSLATGTAPTAGVSYELRDCSGAPSADYAEFYPAAADVTVGEIVVAGNTMVVTTDGDEVAQVIKSASPYQNNIVGVVSDPAKVTDFNVIGYNIEDIDNPMPISLNGRVLMNVSDENGAIAVGDTIASSSVAGVGMKATKTGMIVGYALDTWSGPGQGQIVVFVSPGWHANGTIATDGVANFFNDDFSFNKTGTADAVTTGYDSYGLTLLGSGWNGAAAQDVAMKLKNTVTSATNYKLSIINNAGNEIASINNSGRMRVNGRFDVSGKLYPASPTGFQNTAYIFYQTNYMRTNATGWSTGSYDFAEMFLSREVLEAGDIVSVAEDTNEYVKKSTGVYDSMVLGIVSTEPGFLAGTNVDFDNPAPDQGYPIALAGRVPTKVSTENGPIIPGDPLTASSIPGVAMKATDPGMVIGVALEGWNNPEVRKIKVFVNLSWYGVNGDLTPVSEMSSLTLTGNLDMKGNYILNVAQIVGKDEVWSIDENGILKVKLTNDSTEKEMFGTTSPKVEMTISGTSRLENGAKVVDLSLVDEDFVKNASPDTAYKILVTPNEDCNGIYVSERTPFNFMVKEVRSGNSNASFDWMVVARRKGYDDPAPETPPTPPASPAPPTEPAPSGPAPSEPTPSEPAPSEPAPSEPAPSEPTPEAPAEEPAPAPEVPAEPAP